MVGMEIIPIADLGKILQGGVAIDIYGIHVIGASATAPIVTIYNDTEQTTVAITETTTANVGTTVWYDGGIRFSNGAYIDVAAAEDVTSVTVFYKLV